MRRIKTAIRRQTLKQYTSGKKRVDGYTYKPPSLTGNSDIDWCLWQLTQVLFDIAKSIKTQKEETTDVDD